MLTYSLENTGNIPLYEYIYQCIKQDIQEGRLKPGEKLPSKRTLAGNLGVSTITIEGAYGQLIAEGYCQSVPKRGFFVAEGIQQRKKYKRPLKVAASAEISQEEPETQWKIDFSANSMKSEDFPFAIWTRLLRRVVNEEADALTRRSPGFGVYALREAIAEHLQSFRGLDVLPEQIIVGAGTELLYSFLVQVFGRDKRYCIENPGYDRLKKIYVSNGAECVCAGMDENGIEPSAVLKAGADILHISPAHHYPTGITMPVSRRYELLGWASSKAGRYIIEDDYDSEFRMTGKPIPTLMSIDVDGRVIYMNTFSKSLTPTIRISYMVLPMELVGVFKEKIGFYTCTVSNFEQYTLAKFMKEGHFERHINRMRNVYRKRREELLELFRPYEKAGKLQIIERGSGLHFMIRFISDKTDREILKDLRGRGINISPLSDYYMGDTDLHEPIFIINYSCISIGDMNDVKLID